MYAGSGVAGPKAIKTEMYLLVDDELFEVDESECDLEPDGSGVWFAFEDEDEESFYEFCEVDPDEYE